MMRTDAEIRRYGARALLEALGEVDAERFIALLTREPFDYTTWRRSLFAGKGAFELSREAMAFRSGQQEEDGRVLRDEE
jgi:hypothetical protein